MNDRSNDILADRRFAWAAALSAEEDFAAAADLLDQVVEIAPRWAPGWAALGEARERSGALSGALDAWRRTVALDPGGRLGAYLHVARLSGAAPTAMPDAYVRAVFDDYAPRFDRHLVEQLDYRGPRVLGAALSAHAPGRVFERALDLGCGTGLMGQAIAGRVGRLDGVDLSARMVEAARATGLYDRLDVAPIGALLDATPEGRYGLVLAADVLGYLGDLGPVLAGVHRVLEPGGLFGFTVQVRMPAASGDADPGYGLGGDMRFAYSAAYLETACRIAGLTLPGLDDASIRTERGHAVPGLVGVAIRRPSRLAAGRAPSLL